MAQRVEVHVSNEGPHLLARERARASFRVEWMTNMLDGGPELTKKRRQFWNLVLNDPDLVDFDQRELNFLGREELIGQYLKITAVAVRVLQQLKTSIVNPIEKNIFSRVLPPAAAIGLAHGLGMVDGIQGLGTESQISKWLPLAANYHIIGAYLSTEIGHGTNVRGLETTATYDPESQEFVINSPTLTSIKFWPGLLGKCCTHAVVMARLITKGKDHGVHPFFAQLRSLEDHMPLKGIYCGDIGPTFGWNASDNGFAQFTNVRIPREQMFMRFTKVTPDGTYSCVPNWERLLYINMVSTRCYYLYISIKDLEKSLTIAIRYSAIRCQTSPGKGLPETPVLNYQVQQYRLFSLLSTAYCLPFTTKYIVDAYQECSNRVNRGDVSTIPEVHATVAGLKAFYATMVAEGTKDCMDCCGGHGYCLTSGLPTLYSTHASAVIWEGTTPVMYLQTARFLIKCFLQAQTGDELPDTVAYLKDNSPLTQRDWHNKDVQLKLYGERAKYAIKQAALRLQSLIDEGQQHFEAWNACSVQLVASARAHIHYVVIKKSTEGVNRLLCIDDGSFHEHRVLKMLSDLFALHGIVESPGGFLECGILTSDDLATIRLQVVDLLKGIRPEAVALVDAFDVPDKLLGSTLGRYDGEAYKDVFKWAKKAPMNKKEVIDCYHTYMKPMILGKVAQAKL